MWLCAIAYAVALTALSVERLHAFHAGYDLAIFDQLTWLLGHFHDPFSTVRGRGMLADHFEPGLALFAPLGALSSGPWLLLAAQSLGLAAAAPVLYAIARARGGDPLVAAGIALVWLASPLTQATNLDDFHPEAFVPVLFALSMLGLARSSTLLFVLSAMLAASLKEDVALTYAALGIGIVLVGRARFGVAVAVGGLIWHALAFLGIELAGGSLAYYSHRYGGGPGGSVGQVLHDLVRHPIRALGTVSLRLNAKMVFALVGSTLGVCLLAPTILLAAIPSVADNILSRYPNQHYLTGQYHIVPAGICAAAAAWAAPRLPALRGRRRPAAVAVTCAACVVFLVFSPGLDVLLGRYSDPPHDAAGVAAARRAALRLVPRGAPVAVQLDAIAHVAERRLVYLFPEPFVRVTVDGEYWSALELHRRVARVRYVLLDDTGIWPGTTDQARRARVQMGGLGFHLVFAREGVRLYRR